MQHCRYGISVGAEIGIYNNPQNIGDIRQWTCATGNEMNMQLILLYVNKKDGVYYGEEIFNRSEKHWWLTGFMASINLKKAGFARNNLMVIAQIDFPTADMMNLFVINLKGDGYFLTQRYNNSVVVVWCSKNYSEVYWK